MVTLDEIREPEAADRYPREALKGCRTALVLFAAAWLGKQDAVWICDAGLTGTCVDTDAQKLGEMAAIYPAGWDFVTADVFDYTATTPRQWDVVSVDCPTNLFDLCAESLPLWQFLARRVIILGCGPRTHLDPGEGWQLTNLLHRSNFAGGVYWAVLERC